MMNARKLREEYKSLEKHLKDDMDRLIHAMSVTVDKKIKELEVKELHLSTLQSKMDENAKKARDVITLDIGGALFRTTKSTLLKMEGSYFHAMLASAEWLPNEKGKYRHLSVLILSDIVNVGHYFIDMDPTYFGRIMTYLRSGNLSYEGLTSKETAEFNKVVDYFQLRPTVLEEVPCWDPEFCGDDLTLQENNRRVSKRAYEYNGVQSAKPCSNYSVQVINGRIIYIGFAPRQAFKKNTFNHTTCGWFVFVADGTLYAQGGIRDKAYGTAIPIGSMVTAIHDKSQHTIEFQVDGKSLGIAFSNIPHDELYAAADLHDINDEIRIIDNF